MSHLPGILILAISGSALPFWSAMAEIGVEHDASSWRRRADELLQEGGLAIYAQVGPDLEKALSMLLQAASMYHENEVDQMEALAHEKIGLLYVRLFEYRKSLEYCLKALEFHRQAGNVEDQARLLFYIALYHMNLERLDEARRFFFNALEMYRSAGNTLGEAKVLSSLARYFFRVGDPRQATGYIKRALSLSAGIDNAGLKSRMFYILGGLRMHQGMYREALASFEKIMALNPGAETYLMANVFNSLGFVYYHLGDPYRALSYLDRSALLYKRWDPHHLGLSYSEMGNIYLFLGERQLALEFFLKAKECLGLVDSKNDQASVLYYLGNVHQSSGDHRPALSYYQKALVLVSATRNERGRSLVLHAIGDTYLRTGDFATALNHLFEALASSRNIENRSFESQILTSLGLAYYYLKGYDEAECYFETSLDLQRELGLSTAMALTYRYLCQLHLTTVRLDAALCDCLEAIEIQRATGNLAEEALTLHMLSGIMAAGNHLDTALIYGGSAIEGVETLRGKIMENHLQTLFFSGSQNLFQLQIELLMQVGENRNDSHFVGRALHISERAKARGLLDLLNELPPASADDHLQGLLLRKKYLQQRLNGKAGQRVDLGSPATTREVPRLLDQDLEELLSRYRRVDGQIRYYRSLQERVDESFPLNVEQIQHEILDEETALLEVALGEKKSFLWLITRDGLDGYRLPGREVIESLAIQVYQNLIERGRFPRFETRLERDWRLKRADHRFFSAASELSRILLGQVLPSLKAKRLLIVADGALRTIPFHILPLPENSDENAWMPLLSIFETVTSPSASILASLKRRRSRGAPAPKTLVIFADPVFTSRDERVKAAKTREGIPTISSNLDGSAKVSPRLRRLPHTRDEALHLRQLVSGEMVSLAMGFEANIARLKSPRLRDYRILHFATHALIQDSNPELSSLVFSLVDEEGRARPGYLRQHDIFNLELHAELVVLSGCRTALGKETAGEGLIGMTRGFMCAGALRVIASLWTVQDEATAELMSRFYRNMLAEGMPPSAALREAQLSMWRTSRWEHPFYWSAFIFQGLWD